MIFFERRTPHETPGAGPEVIGNFTVFAEYVVARPVRYSHRLHGGSLFFRGDGRQGDDTAAGFDGDGARFAQLTAPAGPGALGDCWRYADKSWRKLPSQTSLNGCAQALFAGRCEQPGGASYGRWGQQTLRLVPGRVEISADNHSFHTLSDQGAGCSLPGAAG